jgi:flagellar motor component MotA
MKCTENIVLELFQRVGPEEIKKEDLQEYHELIGKMVEYSSTARKCGLLAIEKSIKNESDPFLMLALNLAVDGTEESLITNTMLGHIIADNYRNFTRRLIMLQGIKCLISGDNPRIVEMVLKSFLGGLDSSSEGNQ